ncbi:major Facilitator Superfamily Transporter 10 isoform X2 [Leptinotarsa decemlineata]|uniref:major Facilitator Superfamily Transporter 10 isoform X2 n=1 Tax=Leptinotarsa decemlineata TaxID=7539 RepID=UPI000C253730|nr:putative inorganic phosphate cotransporter isoform X2 [Leptinotarsa decemlineata]
MHFHFETSGEFNWDEHTQSIVLGSFFYGYVITQIPGGRLAEIFGSKRVYGIGVLVTSIFTLLTPIAARINFPLFIIVRIIEGMGEGVTFPSMHAMLAKWIPPLERSKFAAYVYAGTNFGTIVSLPLSGWLCSLELDRGWPLSFYLFGMLGIIWFGFWMYFIYDSPSTHPRIDRQELAYIVASVGPQDENDKSPVPWCSLLKCVPLWAILVTQCGGSWAFYTLLTELPTYMSQILHFDIQANSLLSAIPYLTSWICGILISIFADWLLSKGYLSLSTSYKLFNSIASIVPSLGLLGVAYVGCDRVAVQLLLAIPGAFGGASYAGCQMNHIALSPKYAGTMYGITNAAGNICGFLAPYVIGLIIEGRETLGQWRMVFYLAAGINIGTNLFYIAFASAREQPWSRSQRTSTAN